MFGEIIVGLTDVYLWFFSFRNTFIEMGIRENFNDYLRKVFVRSIWIVQCVYVLVVIAAMCCFDDQEMYAKSVDMFVAFSWSYFLLVVSILVLYPFYEFWKERQYEEAEVKLASTAETLMPGSTFLTTSIDERLWRVCLSWKTGATNIAGTAFAISYGDPSDNRVFLITAFHNIAHQAAVSFHNMVTGKTIWLHRTKIVKLAEDAVAIQVDRDCIGQTFTYGDYGVGEVQVAAAVDDRNVSIGVLRPAMLSDGLGFGRVVYNGSTRGGFSGAPYVRGKTVVGMHTNGGAFNNGYSMSYLMMRLKKEMSEIKESSEDEMIRRMLKVSGKKDVEHHLYAPGEIQIRVGGRYVFMDEEDFSSIRKDFSHLFDVDVHEESRQDLDTMKIVKVIQLMQQLERTPVMVKPVTVLENTPETLINGLMDKVSEKFQKIDDRINFLEQQETKEYVTNDVLAEDVQKMLLQQAQQVQLIEKMAEKMQFLQQAVDSQKNSMDLLELQSEEAITSQQQDQQRLKTALDNISPIDSVQLTAMLDQQDLNMKHQLEERCAKMQSSFDDLQDQMKKILMTTSTLSSEVSKIKQVPLDYPSSSRPQQSQQLLDGMDEDFETFKQWRSSVDTSSPDYGDLRERFFQDQKWTPTRCLALVKRMHNQVSRERKARMIRVMKGESVEESRIGGLEEAVYCLTLVDGTKRYSNWAPRRQWVR